jgi:hypothetical protein
VPPPKFTLPEPEASTLPEGRITTSEAPWLDASPKRLLQRHVPDGAIVPPVPPLPEEEDDDDAPPVPAAVVDDDDDAPPVPAAVVDDDDVAPPVPPAEEDELAPPPAEDDDAEVDDVSPPVEVEDVEPPPSVSGLQAPNHRTASPERQAWRGFIGGGVLALKQEEHRGLRRDHGALERVTGGSYDRIRINGSIVA